MPKRSPRLQFTEEECENPVLKKAIKKSDKVADKLDKAESQIPTQKKIVKERTTDPATGKSVVHLRFEETEKKPPSKLAHITADTPIDALALQFHREAKDSDNSAAEAVDAGVSTAESALHTAQAVSYPQKLQPYRAAVRAENQADKANLNALQKTVQQSTSNSNAYSKYLQKKAIKKEYVNAKRTSENTAKASEIASKAAATAAEKTKQTVEFVKKNKKWILPILALGALLLMFMSIISSCSMMFQGALGSIGTTTYQSTPEDMADVEAAYCDMETALQEKIDNYEYLCPGYDEYRVTGTVLGHDPYVLTSILSAVHGEYTLSDVRSDLESIFNMQYELTETVTTETRYRTETRTAYYQYRDPNTGDIYLIPYTYEVQVPYAYTICTVMLTCTAMEDLVNDLLTEEQQELYETYMETKGNYPDLFSD
ncbi:MAG: peptidase M23 [Clostridia bacterium]|nr:peptidase M23 [Clostridia bacterium]